MNSDLSFFKAIKKTSYAVAIAACIVPAIFSSGSFAKVDGGGTAPAKKTNVILLMSDDQGWGDVAYNGNDIIHTPSLDRKSVV